MNETRPWFYADHDQTFGPVDALEIEQLIQQAVITPSTWMLAEGSENWMLAKDSPFAAQLENAPSQPGPQDQGPADAAPSLIQPDSVLPLDGEQPGEGLSAKFSQLGSAVLSETRRSARLASIKAIIEKLKRVDLTKAHYALGKKAYELQIDQDRFSEQYREISALEEAIRIKRAGNAADESATMLENFRGATINAKSAVKAEAFEIKRKQWLIRVGKEYRPSSVPIAIENEFAVVGSVEAQIEKREAEYASVSADRIPLLKLGHLARTIIKTTVRQITPSKGIGTQINNDSVRAQHRIVDGFHQRFMSIRKTRLIASVVIMVLVCLIGARFVSKRHHHAVEDPEQQFQQFQMMAEGIAGPATDTVGRLKSGMTMPAALAALNTVEITESFSSDVEYKQLLQQYIFDTTLETGDTLKSILLRNPAQLSPGIACVALAFFNGGLFRITYIYEPQEIQTIVPKEAKYAGDGDKSKVQELRDSWTALVESTVSAAAQKYTPVTLKFVNFFEDSPVPKVISPSGDGAETILFHGASKVAVAHIAYRTQDKHDIGFLDPDSTITTFYEQRVIVADFLFLDFAREHGLSYYSAKVKVLRKQEEEERSSDAANRQKMIDDDAKEHLRAAEEEKSKREQLGKNF